MRVGRIVACLAIAACSGTALVQDGGDDATTNDASFMDASDATVTDAPHDSPVNDVATDAATDADADATIDAAQFIFDGNYPDVDAACPYVPIVDPEVVVYGTPSWRTSEVLVYAAKLGDPSDASAAVTSTLAVLGANHTYDTAKNIYKSSHAHAAPWDYEFTANIIDSGYVNNGCFSLSDLKSPSGLLIIINLVPSSTATTGITFEEPDGGQIALVGDLAVSAELDIDGGLVDPNFSGMMPKAGFAYDYTGPYAGFGHLIVSFGENDTFSPNTLTSGSYTLTYTLSDNYSGKTQQTIHFVVQ